MIVLDVEVEGPDWDALGDVAALGRRAAEATFASLPSPPEDDLAATLLLTDDGAVRNLNLAWRGQDKPTNVLSFPSPAMPGTPRQIGDIAIAFQTVAMESRRDGKTIEDHAAHLIVHGLLHLLGHDHEDDLDAEDMERIERVALARIGIADPYRATAEPG